MQMMVTVPHHIRLFESIGDLSLVSNEGNSPLHFAAQRCNVDLIEEIIRRAEGLLLLKNVKGMTPVRIAILSGRSQDVVGLLAPGGSVAHNDKNVIWTIIHQRRYELLHLFPGCPVLSAGWLIDRAVADNAPDWVLRVLWRDLQPGDVIPKLVSRPALIAELAQSECAVCMCATADMFVGIACGHSHLCGECVVKVHACPICRRDTAFIRMF
jgi:hypothetical protein